jgi:hypothetical protein
MSRLTIFLSLAALLATVTVTDASSAAPDDSIGFDKQAASSALSSVDLAKCKTTNARRGEGHVMVKFAPGGVATEATVDRGPMIGTPVAKCIAKEFKKQAKVPAFKGSPVQVGKIFHFD